MERSADILLCISLFSEDDPATGRPYYDALYLSNYTLMQIKDELARVPGVGDIFLFHEFVPAGLEKGKLGLGQSREGRACTRGSAAHPWIPGCRRRIDRGWNFSAGKEKTTNRQR